MIATIINIILLLYALKHYIKREYTVPIFTLAFFFTNAFIINIGTPLIKYTDFGVLQLLLSSLIGFHDDRRFFSINRNVGAKIIGAMLLFFIVVLFYSFINKVDSIPNIITVIRVNIAYLTYFVFRKASNEDLHKAMIICFKLIIIASILFIIQYITRIELVSTYVSEANLNSSYRMQVTPPWLSISVLYLVLFGKTVKLRWYLVIILFAVLLISQNRTAIYGLIFCLSTALLLGKNIKNKIPIFLLLFTTYLLASTVSEMRSKEHKEAVSIAQVGSYIKNKEFVNLAMTSTFMFRIALISERIEYLLENPSNLLLGVGAIHEYSPKIDQFDFSVGTAGVNDKGQAIKAQLDSVDVLWGPIIIRFGIIGLFIHLFFLYKSLLLFYKSRHKSLNMIGFLVVLNGLITSFSSGGFFGYPTIFVICVLIVYHDKKIDIS